MVPPAKLHHLYQSVLHNISAVEHPVEGAFVECGVWRGGATMMMVYAELAALARDGMSPIGTSGSLTRLRVCQCPERTTA